MSDPYLSIQRQIQALQEQLEVLRKADSTLFLTGTYVPTYLGTVPGVTTYSVQQGAWVRIGQMIIATGTITWTAASGTGTAVISLPFTSSSTTNQNFGGSVWMSSVTFANSTPLVLIGPASATLSLFSPLTNAGNTAVAVEAAGTLVWTVIYLID